MTWRTGGCGLCHMTIIGVCVCAFSLQSAEVYQKKSKTELQKSIRRLKEENNMYISLNKELNKKLIEVSS